MAMAGLYRRVLPSPPAIDFASTEGKQLFLEAVQSGTMEGFFKLISYFQTQSEPAYCGLASLAMILNALAVDPGRKWKGPWRWFDESMLDCCEPLEKVKAKGISFGKVVCLAHCAGVKVDAFRTNQSTIDDFRNYVVACPTSDGCHVISSYNRGTLKQTGAGHFSPIGGYHAGKDMVLILDVARFKFMLISRLRRAPSLLYTLSCKHAMLDLRSSSSGLQKFGDERDGDQSLGQEEKGRLALKEEVLKQVQETGLYKHVTDYLSSEKSCCRTIPTSGHEDILPDIAASVCCQGAGFLAGSSGSLDGLCCRETSVKSFNTNGDRPITVVSGTVVNALILALPLETWSGIREEKLLQEIHSLVSTEDLPTLLQEEVFHLRGQLLILKRCRG
ncbi:hypothetical protein F0562_002413 [Nyssa sinensis]|uniref:glutathione gamma-glutamylcysteinyltransferase n=1 Tax=Nyssa sinensis TaxID=561372 RepID=A0A5J5C675_9ASTE|nr:hypothetical protein F0562_002413 [Nyssa sinensis]